MMAKQVSYAYPTSDIADAHNMPRGCWIVETGDGKFAPWPKTIASVWATEKQAIDAAYLIELPWSQCWLYCIAQRTVLGKVEV